MNLLLLGGERAVGPISVTHTMAHCFGLRHLAFGPFSLLDQGRSPIASHVSFIHWLDCGFIIHKQIGPTLSKSSLGLGN